MIEKPSSIKLLLKLYNNIQDNKDHNLFTISTNNDCNKAASNTNFGNNLNYRYTTNSLISIEKNNNTINHINKDNNNKMNINNTNDITSDLKQEYLIHFQTDYPYNNLENKYPPKVINIKTCIYLYLLEKQNMNLTLDSLLLYQLKDGKFILLNDEDYFLHQLDSKIQINEDETGKNDINNLFDINKNEKNNPLIIYYSINKAKIKILIELYSKSIDRITLIISKTCSLLMLKYIMILKLKNIEKAKDMTNIINNISESINNNLSNNYTNKITINEIEKMKIYGNGIANNNFNQYLFKNQTNRNFNNSSIISEIYNYYITNLNSSIIKDNNSNIIMNDNISISKGDLNDGILSFIMMEQKNNKCSLGLDFRFTILQSFIPISEEENKEENKNDIITFKNYIKNDSYLSKNGLNLYFNCLNNECKYNNKFFILNAGYGNYDIFSLIKYNAYCPFCYKSKQEFLKEKNLIDKLNDKNNNNNLELKYIGMMNAKWAYKGYLIGIKNTVVEGKGMTVIKDILYKSKEFDFLNQFKRLLFEIERYNSKNKYNPIFTKNDSSIYSDNYNFNNGTEINNDINLKENIDNIASKGNEIFNETDNNYRNSKKFSIKNENCINLTLNENQKDINNEKEKNKIIVNNKNEYNNNNTDNNNINNNKIYNDIIINKNNDKIIKYENFYNNRNDNNINKFNNNINNNNINYDYKKSNIMKNINENKRNKNFKKIYYGNSKKSIPILDGNETKNTNVDFNIIIDNTNSNCCDKCFDCQQVSQVCSIY